MRFQSGQESLVRGRHGGRRETRRLPGTIRQVAAEDDDLQRREGGLEERTV